MFYVYVLKNPNGELYKGATGHIEQRIRQHQTGQSRWTKHHGPWQLIYTENFTTLNEALKREKFFKSGKGRELLKNILAER